MAISLTGKSLTIEDIESVARQGEKVALHDDAVQRIHTCTQCHQRRPIREERDWITSAAAPARRSGTRLF